MHLKNKKAAFELSVSTIIIIAIGATMLILGLILLRNIFSGATNTVDLIDKNTKSKINELFNQDTSKTVVYLPQQQAEVSKGKNYNIVFGIKNVVRGESEAGKFTYSVHASEVQQGCKGLSVASADKFVILGATSSTPIPILAGEDPVERTIKVEIPETAPLCSITYDIIVKKDGSDYDTNYFILDITE